jgi:hypothetical protein
MVSGPAYAQGKYEMTPEEVEAYKLSLQQEAKAADAYNKTPEGKAEIHRRFEHDVQSQADQQAAEGAQVQKRMARDYHQPIQQQHMCILNVGGGATEEVPCP